MYFTLNTSCNWSKYIITTDVLTLNTLEVDDHANFHWYARSGATSLIGHFGPIIYNTILNSTVRVT